MKMVILCQSGLLTFGQGDLHIRKDCPEQQFFQSFQHFKCSSSFPPCTVLFTLQVQSLMNTEYEHRKYLWHTIRQMVQQSQHEHTHRHTHKQVGFYYLDRWHGRGKGPGLKDIHLGMFFCQPKQEISHLVSCYTYWKLHCYFPFTFGDVDKWR